VQILEGRRRPLCYQLAAQVIIGRDIAGGQVVFIVFIDIQDGLPVLRLLDTVAVTVIEI